MLTEARHHLQPALWGHGSVYVLLFMRHPLSIIVQSASFPPPPLFPLCCNTTPDENLIQIKDERDFNPWSKG